MDRQHPAAADSPSAPSRPLTRQLLYLRQRLRRAGWDGPAIHQLRGAVVALGTRYGLVAIWSLAFFALGINRYVVYVPFFALAISATLITSWRSSRLRPWRQWLPQPAVAAVVALALCATVPVYGLALWTGQLTVGSHALVTTTFAMVAAAWTLQFFHQPWRQRLLGAYILGIAFQILLLCLHNMGPELANLRGRGMLEDPFDGHHLNSPAPSNLAAMVFAWCWYLVVCAKRWWQVVLAALFAQALLLVGVFFAGRAFFVVIPLAILVVGLWQWRWRGLLRSLLALLLVFLPLLVVYALSEQLREFTQLALDRLINQGLRSARWPLLVDGWQQLWQHPWGGFDPNPHLVRMPWFHNLFLDMARIAGWLPIAALAALGGVALRGLWRRRDPNQLLPLLLALISSALMQQDVILEGNPRLFIIAVLCAAVLVSNHRGSAQLPGQRGLSGNDPA